MKRILALIKRLWVAAGYESLIEQECAEFLARCDANNVMDEPRRQELLAQYLRARFGL